MNALASEMARGRRPQKRAEETRQRLLEAGIKGFAAQGFDGATVVALEQAAGVQRGVLAYHFGTKDALWRAAIDHLFAMMERNVQAMAQASRVLPDFDPLTVMVGGFIRFNAEHPELQRIVLHQSQHGGARMDYLVEHHIRRLLIIVAGVSGHEMSVHDFYIYMGAVNAPFAWPYEGKAVWNVDTRSDEFLRQHTRLVVRILRELWREPGR